FTSNWYPFDLGKSLDDAIVRVLGGGKTEFFERLGEASAEQNLGTHDPRRRHLQRPRLSHRRRLVSEGVGDVRGEGGSGGGGGVPGERGKSVSVSGEVGMREC
ncbi:MAG: hypothetical protein ACREMX_04570, partial [Gemmatimonadales bacterium]